MTLTLINSRFSGMVDWAKRELLEQGALQKSELSPKLETIQCMLKK